MSILRVGLDETDVAAALDARDLYFVNIFGFGSESHIFLEIVFGNLVSTHGFAIELSILHDYSGSSLDHAAKGVGMISSDTEDSMKDDKNESDTERGKKWGGAIDGSRQHRSDDHD